MAWAFSSTSISFYIYSGKSSAIMVKFCAKNYLYPTSTQDKIFPACWSMNEPDPKPVFSNHSQHQLFYSLVTLRSRYQNGFDEQGVFEGESSPALQPKSGVDLKNSRRGKSLLQALSSKPIHLHYVEGKPA